MLVDFDDVFVEHALKHGYVSAEQVAECKKALKKEIEGGRKYYLGQVLIRKRYLTCGDFLEIENELGHKLYECAACKARYGVADLSEKGTVACKGCGAEVKIDGGLSIVEILASRDPRDLTISLCPTNGDAVAPPRAQTSRLTPPGASQTPAKPAATTDDKAKSKSRLNRAVLELSKDELSGLQRYEVLDELGRGGMGIVFKARQVDIDRVCALKVIKAGPSVPEVQINRFVQEARSAAQLNHPNIVTVYDFGRFRDMFYIAMEFIPGTPLSKLIFENQVTQERALEITDDLLSAVAYAHTKGVIHRDLKPQNILVETERGRARLIDFGLAKDNTGGLGLTQTGQILGSPFYLSPEQTRGESRNVDPRSDVFAIGVILYEMVTRVRPFTGRSAAEVYAKILKERPAPPSAVEPDVDQTLQAVVLKALEKRPEDRFQSAEEFQKALQEYRATRGTEEQPRANAARAKALTARLQPATTSARSSSVKNRSSDRAVAKRTSTQLATLALEERLSRPSGSRGALVGVLVALFVGGALLVASQGHSSTSTADDGKKSGDADHHQAVAIATTRSAPDEPPPAEREDLAAVEREERETPNLWGSLLNDWKKLGESYEKELGARARARTTEIERGAQAEADQLVARIDAAPADKQAEAARAIQDALTRFLGTRWHDALEARAKRAADDAWEAASQAAALCDRRIAVGDFAGAIAAVNSRTGFEKADRLIDDERKKVREAEEKKTADAQASAELAKGDIPRRLELARVARKERRYEDALKTLDGVLAMKLEDIERRQVAIVRSETALTASVLAGALEADIAAALKARKDVTLEVAKGVRTPAIRVKDGALYVKLAGSGEIEYAIAKLPARAVCRLFELSPGNLVREAPLARALFLLEEGELEGARLAFDEARRRNVDVSAFERRFSALPEQQPAPATAQKEPAPTKSSEEKPVKDDGALVAIAAGTFAMGIPDGQIILGEHDPDPRNAYPDHSVALDAYAIGKYEVTNHQYARFLEAIKKGKAHRFCHPDEPRDKDHTPALWKSGKFGGDAHPVVGVDWWDAYAFCRYAGGRLPTEAEWERAARGTDGRVYPWGMEWDPKKCVSAAFWAKDDTRYDDVWDRFLDFVKTASQVTLPVDSLPEGRSPSGCYNMAGNAAEWVGDYYDERFYAECWKKGDLTKNPQGPEKGSLRVVRGGHWEDRTPAYFQTTARSGFSPGTRVDWLGFRCAKGADSR